MYKNEMKLIIPSLSQNESFARAVVGAFASQLNPTLEELADIKTAVSEAVTNSIVHGYEDKPGNVEVEAKIEGEMLTVIVRDKGRGIADIKEAMQPFFTTKPEAERSGMGFTVMETFMDSLQVESTVGAGTTVRMKKKISSVQLPGEEK